MGTLVTGKWEPYQYLAESIKKFPKQEEFKVIITFFYHFLMYYSNSILLQYYELFTAYDRYEWFQKY